MKIQFLTVITILASFSSLNLVKATEPRFELSEESIDFVIHSHGGPFDYTSQADLAKAIQLGGFIDVIEAKKVAIGVLGAKAKKLNVFAHQHKKINCKYYLELEVQYFNEPGRFLKTELLSGGYFIDNKNSCAKSEDEFVARIPLLKPYR